MLRGLLAAIAAVTAGCAVEQEPVPIAVRDAMQWCTEAVDLYYRAGCTYFVTAGEGAAVPMPHDLMAGVCDALGTGACRDQMQSWRLCSRRASAPTCGCSEQLAAVLWCR